MNWIRCNRCFLKREGAQESFYLVQCGHVFCNKCTFKEKSQCPVCKTTDLRNVSLKEPLAPELVPYFTPLEDHANQLLKTIMFRQNMQLIVLQQFEEMELEYKRGKELYWEGQRNLKKWIEFYKKSKIELRICEEKLRSYEAHIKNRHGIINENNVPSLASLSSVKRLCGSIQTPRVTPLNHRETFSVAGLSRSNLQSSAASVSTQNTSSTIRGFMMSDGKNAPSSAGTESDRNSVFAVPNFPAMVPKSSRTSNANFGQMQQNVHMSRHPFFKY